MLKYCFISVQFEHYFITWRWWGLWIHFHALNLSPLICARYWRTCLNRNCNVTLLKRRTFVMKYRLQNVTLFTVWWIVNFSMTAVFARLFFFFLVGQYAYAATHKKNAKKFNIWHAIDCEETVLFEYLK